MKRARPRLGPGLAGDTLLSLGAIGIVGGSSAVYSLAVGRWLGQETLGQASIALAVGMGLAQVGVSGVGPAATRFVAAALAAGRPAEASSALRHGLSAAILLGAALAAACWLTADRWSGRVGLSSNLVTAAAVLVVAQSTYIGLKAVLYGLGRVRSYAVAEAAGGLAFGLLLVAVVAGGRVTLLAPFLGANFVFMALAAVGVARGMPRHSEPAARERRAARSLGSMPRFAVVATIGSAAALARLSLAPLVTGSRWPASEVGLLQAALSFLLVVMFVPRALELSLFPLLAAAHGRSDPDRLRGQASAASEASAVVLGAVGGTVLLAGRPLLVGLYGAAYAPALASLVWAVVAGWALGLAVPAVAALSGANAVWVPNLAALLGLATSLCVWAWRVPVSGAEGAAMGLALGSIVNAALPIAAAARMLGVRLVDAARVVGASLALLAAGSACIWWLGAPALAAAAGYLALFGWIERRWVHQVLAASGWRGA